MDSTSSRGLTSSFVAHVMGPLVTNVLSAMAQLLLPSSARSSSRAPAAAAGTNLVRSSGSRNEQQSNSSKAPEEKPCPPRPIPTNLRPRQAPPAAAREQEQLPDIKKQLFGQAAGGPDPELEPPASHPEQLVHTKIQELLQPRSPFAAKLQVAIKDFGQRFGADCPLPLFALALADAAADLSVRVVLRTVTETKQYWSGKAGRSFLMCMSPAAVAGPGAGSGAAAGSSMSSCLIIDRGFRDAFTTPMMTPRYKQMCASLPEVFVGQPAQLTSLLHLACYELDVMFRSLGRHVPPWRTFPAASARWLSPLCSDVIVPATARRRERDAAATLEVREFLARCERMKAAGAARPAGGAGRQPAAQQYPTVQGFHPRMQCAGQDDA